MKQDSGNDYDNTNHWQVRSEHHHDYNNTVMENLTLHIFFFISRGWAKLVEDSIIIEEVLNRCKKWRERVRCWMWEEKERVEGRDRKCWPSEHTSGCLTVGVLHWIRQLTFVCPHYWGVWTNLCLLGGLNKYCYYATFSWPWEICTSYIIKFCRHVALLSVLGMHSLFQSHYL